MCVCGVYMVFDCEAVSLPCGSFIYYRADADATDTHRFALNCCKSVLSKVPPPSAQPSSENYKLRTPPLIFTTSLLPSTCHVVAVAEEEERGGWGVRGNFMIVATLCWCRQRFCLAKTQVCQQCSV